MDSRGVYSEEGTCVIPGDMPCMLGQGRGRQGHWLIKCQLFGLFLQFTLTLSMSTQSIYLTGSCWAESIKLSVLVLLRLYQSLRMWFWTESIKLLVLHEINTNNIGPISKSIPKNMFLDLNQYMVDTGSRWAESRVVSFRLCHHRPINVFWTMVAMMMMMVLEFWPNHFTG